MSAVSMSGAECVCVSLSIKMASTHHRPDFGAVATFSVEKVECIRSANKYSTSFFGIRLGFDPGQTISLVPTS